MEDVTLRTNDDGLLEAVLDDGTQFVETLDTPNVDTDSDDDDGDGDENESDTEASESTDVPDSPDAPQSASSDTQTTETAADGGEASADDTDTADSDGDETPEMLTPDGLDKPDENAPESQKRRIFKIKAKLRAAGTGDRNDFLTADDLADDLGWDRDIIDATIEKLRRESNAMFGDPDEGWQMSK
jgi:cobalamin biosynthesis protein CobT